MDDLLIEKFYEKMKKVDLDVYGILDRNDNVLSLGTDSKVLGRIFEIKVQPILKEIAEENDFVLETPEIQTEYPDFIMIDKSDSKKKIAIDVKSAYQKSNNSQIKFTLGTFKSYMQDNTSSIAYDYTDFVKHYVIGFIYKRTDGCNAQESEIVSFKDRKKVLCPYTDVKFFVQEKYKIAGEKRGSGDTDNIGSFATKKYDDLRLGKGPFAELGIDIYELYWRYHSKNTDTEKNYKTLLEFANWFVGKKEEDVPLLHKYDYSSVLEKIKRYIKETEKDGK